MNKSSKIFVAAHPDPNSNESGRNIYVITRLINVIDYGIGEKLTTKQMKDLLEYSQHDIIISSP